MDGTIVYDVVGQAGAHTATNANLSSKRWMPVRVGEEAQPR